MLEIHCRLGFRLLLISWFLLGLSACGGDNHIDEFHNHADAEDLQAHFDEFHDGIDPSKAWAEGVFPDAFEVMNLCEMPRTGVDPFTGDVYYDAQGSTLDENNFLRSLTNDVYLWYDEVEDLDPAGYETQEYFQLLKTTELTETGTPRDQFHWSVNTDEFNAQSVTGEAIGYGASFALLSSAPPREVVVVQTLPDTPAAAAGIERGARILSIDGVDVINDDTQAGVDVLNEGLYPNEIGVPHTFVVQDLGAEDSRIIEMAADVVFEPSVPIVSVISTQTGGVGYVLFNSHTNLAETALIEAIGELSEQGVSDLILDLRYNGGGLLDIASELGYMIAGNNTLDKTFETVTFNDKHTEENPFTGETLAPIPFHDVTLGYSEPAGVGLPTLNLDRVFVLTGANTCSASESLMNSLRGVDVEVVQIGSTTCGKPYGAYLVENCGTSYFTIQFKGTNAKGYGDYADGLFPGLADSDNAAELPGCVVADDYNHLLGNINEARLSAALVYRETGLCEIIQAKPFAQKVSAPINDGVVRQYRGYGDKILRNDL